MRRRGHRNHHYLKMQIVMLKTSARNKKKVEKFIACARD